MTSAADMRQRSVEHTQENKPEKLRHTPSNGEGIRGDFSSCSLCDLMVRASSKSISRNSQQGQRYSHVAYSELVHTEL